MRPTVAEEKLLGLLVASDELRNIMLPRLEPGDYEGLATAAIFRALKELGDDGQGNHFRFVKRGNSGQFKRGRDSPAHYDERTR